MSYLLMPLNFLFLQLDGIIYSLLGHSFKIFRIISQLNFQSLIVGVNPIINRIKAIIMVLIFVKLGITLIQYLMNPAKLKNEDGGGSKILVRIFTVAAFLILYNPIFGVLNEISMLIIGYDSAPGIITRQEVEFHYLKYFGVEASDNGLDEGLLARIIFGKSNAAFADKFGFIFAGQTLSLFLYDESIDDSGWGTFWDIVKALGSGRILGGLIDIFGWGDGIREAIAETTGLTGMASVILTGGQWMENFTLIKALTPYIGHGVEYVFPIISHLVGGYLCWVVMKIAIELAVRMFKLIALQLLAPVAIIAHLEPRTHTTVTKKFLTAYWQIYCDAFIRIGALYLMMGVIFRIFENKASFFSQNGVAAYFTIALVIVAAVKFVQKLPDLLSSVLGIKFSSDGSMSFGKFLAGAKSMVGGAIGLGAGAISGARAAKNAGSGKAGRFFNSIKTAIGGAQAGYKGKGIADKFNAISANNEAGIKRAESIAAAGGLGGYMRGQFETAVGRGRAQDSQLRILDRRQQVLEKYDKSINDAIKDEKATSADILKITKGEEVFDEYAADVKFGNDATDYAVKMRERNKEIQKLKKELIAASNKSNVKAMLELEKQIKEQEKISDGLAKELFKLARENAADNDENIRHLQNEYYKLFKPNKERVPLNVADELAEINKAQKDILNSDLYTRTHNSNKE